MPLMSDDEYNAVLALINKLSEQNEALKEEERNIKQQLKKGRQLVKEKHARKNAPPRQQSVTSSRPKSSPAQAQNRPSSPVVVRQATDVSRNRKICSPVPKKKEDMTTCWQNKLFKEPVQDMYPCSPDFEDFNSILSRLVSIVYEEAKLMAQIMDTENKISCAGNVFDAIQEYGLVDHMIIPSQPTVLAGPTPALRQKEVEPIKQTVLTPTPQEEQRESLPAAQTSSAKLQQASTSNFISSKSPSNLADPNMVPSQTKGLATPTPDSQQNLPPISSSSAKLLQASTGNSIFSKSPSHSDNPKIITSEPTGLTTPSQDLQELPKEEEKEQETLEPRESCAETLISSSDPTYTKSSYSDIPMVVPPEQAEPTASAPVYQQMALPPPNLEKTNLRIMCQACCSAARHRAISERKASIHEAVKEMTAIQECLDEVQEVIKNHSSIKDVMYLQESLSNVEVSILSAHFSLATAPQLDGDDDESIVSYRTPDDIITIWMDVDATKRRLSLLMAHAQECKMCKDSFDTTFYRIEEELLGLAEELKRYHNQEPTKSL